MWDRYTERARGVIKQAQVEAQALGQDFIAPEHLLLGLAHDEGNISSTLMGRLGVAPVAVREALRERYHPAAGESVRDLQLTSDARRVLTVVYDEAARLNNNYIGTEHLLSALAGDGGLAGEVLRGQGLSPERVREAAALFQSGGA